MILIVGGDQSKIPPLHLLLEGTNLKLAQIGLLDFHSKSASAAKK